MSGTLLAGNESLIRRESPQDASSFHNCNFRVLSQCVTIGDIDLLERSFSVFTELSLVPLHPELRQVCLNIGRDIKLPNEIPENATARITVNDEDAEYFRKDSLKTLGQSSECRLNELVERMYDELVDSEGDLVINIPESCYNLMDEQRVIKVGIDVKVANPKHGVHFFIPPNSDNGENVDVHIFSYRSNMMSSTPEWLPCLNSPDQLCLWSIEATVDTSFTFIASGELINTEYTSDMNSKIYTYQLMIPTSAVNIGFAVGQFTPIVFPDMLEITNFTLPSLYPLVRHTTTTVDRIFEFFEELLSCRFPFSSYKQVFVAQAPVEAITYTGLSIFSISLLYHKRILDLVQIKKLLNEVCEYESRWGKITLRPASINYEKTLHFDPRNPYTVSPLYVNAMFTKGHLIMRMLSLRLGRESFIQVVQKILSVAMQYSHQHNEPASWLHMTVSTESFFRTVSNVTGHELPTFLEQWIYGGGHAKFLVQFSFNRKRNMIELEVIQKSSSHCGRQIYVGPLTVIIQELDGSFSHTIQIDSDHTRHDLQCHSKGRRQKKKKIPLSTGEELEIDLANMDPDSPVLWIRVDPNLLLVRKMNIRQPVYQWEYMLKYERSVLSQLQALDVLERFPSPHVRSILIEAIETDAFFYRVRCRAAFTLANIVNKLPESWLGSPALIILFKKFFGCKSAPHIPKPNNFVATSANLQQYFLMHALPKALARLRSTSNICLPEVHNFLIGLIRYNDNSTNRYSDDYYRASLIKALAATITPNDNRDVSNVDPDSLSAEVKDLLYEFTLALNMDTLKPSFGRVVGISALQAIYQLQRANHIPLDPKIFWSFAQPGLYILMRLASLTLVIDMVHCFKPTFLNNTVSKLFEISVSDTEPAVRYHIASQLSLKPPLCVASGVDDQSSKEFKSSVWSLICNPETEPLLRDHYIDFWYALYGSGATTDPKQSGSVSAPAVHNWESRKNLHFMNTKNDLDDLLSTWHDTGMERDEPDSPVNSLSSEMNDDMLQ